MYSLHQYDPTRSKLPKNKSSTHLGYRLVQIASGGVSKLFFSTIK